MQTSLISNVVAWREIENSYYEYNFQNKGNGYSRIRFFVYGFDNRSHDVSIGFYTTANGEVDPLGLKEINVNISRNNVELFNITKKFSSANLFSFTVEKKFGIYYSTNTTIKGIVIAEFLVNGEPTNHTFIVDFGYMTDAPPLYKQLGIPLVEILLAILFIGVIIIIVYIIKKKKK